MKKQKIQIDGSCSIELTTWENGEFEPTATIETVHRRDPYNGDIEISADIDKEKAIEIIDKLKETFSI